MFHKKRKMMSAYNPETRPVLRCSICTGEQVAGFQEITTGKFTDICLIKDEKDLLTFRNEYGIRDGQEIKKIY